MNTQTLATEIVNYDELSPLSSFQNDALKDAEKELETLKKELDGKKYLIDVDKNDILAINSFIVNDAPWKFTESLGINEIEKELKKSVKEGKLFITAIAIEAINYFLSKVEGTGKKTNSPAFTSSDHYIKILKAIKGGTEKIKIDTDRVNNAEYVVAARREGIDTEAATNEQPS